MIDEDRVAEGLPPIRVLLIEDHPLVREGVKLLLEREPGLAVAGAAADGEAGLRLVAQLAAEEAVDVVVSDIGLPGLDGLELTRRIKALVPSIPVVLLTMHDGDEYLRGMLEAGADGYVLKQHTGQDLCGAIRAVRRGEPGLSSAVAGRLLRLLRQGERRGRATD
jgi:DNA-binding NarL/FixJ family response regulator